MTLDEANELWYKLGPIEGIRFRYNDAVRIHAGEHTGSTASVISLDSLKPISYLVELPTGGDVVIAEAFLEIVDT